MELQEFLGYFPDAKSVGEGWQARCPVHDDRKASLSISKGKTKKVVMCCHAGCSNDDILRKLNVTWADIEGNKPKPRKATPKKEVAWYDYQDENGNLVFQVVRFEPKDFRQRKRNAKGDWDWSVKGVRKVPFNLPAIVSKPDEPVFIVEGEKDVLTLASVGLLATCNAGGAGKWTKEHAKPLIGRAIYTTPDNDVSGRSHVKQIIESFSGTGTTVKAFVLPGLPTKGDVTDWVNGRECAEPADIRMQLLAIANNPAHTFREIGNTHEPEKEKPLTNALIQNFRWRKTDTVDRDGNAKWECHGVSADSIWSKLNKVTSGWPKRAGNLLFVPNNESPLFLSRPVNLFAWMQLAARTEGDSNPVQWAEGKDKLAQGQFFEYLRQCVDGYEAVEGHPHYPSLPDHYYIHPKVTGGDGAALKDLLSRFSPATDTDRELIQAFLLSLVVGINPGSRPGFLFIPDDCDDGAGRGIGKTTLPKLCSELVGGYMLHSAAESGQDFIKRLLSPLGLSRRVALIDNIKSSKFSSADVEAMITTNIISGHQMYAGEGRRPNNLVWCLTVNGANLSKDLAQRVVPIKLKRATCTGTWETETLKFINDSRWSIIGDLIAILEHGESKPLSEYSRWGAWEESVLRKLPNPRKCQELIKERQSDYDGDLEEMETVRSKFIEQLKLTRHSPTISTVLIPSQMASQWYWAAMDLPHRTGSATGKIESLAIPELKRHRSNSQRGFIWRGPEAECGAQWVEL